MKLRKIILPIIAILCVGAIALLVHFASNSFDNEKEFSTSALKQYTISFDENELIYTQGVNFMQGVTAVDENGCDLIKDVTVSIKPTNNIKKKELSYSINKVGYEIKSFSRDLIVRGEYDGPLIKIVNGQVEVPIDQLKSLSAIVNSIDILETDDGFGSPCSVSARINEDEIELGDYVAIVTAENLLGDVATAKLTVTVTEAEGSKIKLSARSITVNAGEKVNPADYIVSCVDEEYGDLTPYIVYNEINTSKSGRYTITYKIKGITELKDEHASLTVIVK